MAPGRGAAAAARGTRLAPPARDGALALGRRDARPGRRRRGPRRAAVRLLARDDDRLGVAGTRAGPAGRAQARRRREHPVAAAARARRARAAPRCSTRRARRAGRRSRLAAGVDGGAVAAAADPDRRRAVHARSPTRPGWRGSTRRSSASSAAPTTRARTSRLLLDAFALVRAGAAGGAAAADRRGPAAARRRPASRRPASSPDVAPLLRECALFVSALAPGGLRHRRRRGARLRRAGDRHAVGRAGGARAQLGRRARDGGLVGAASSPTRSSSCSATSRGCASCAAAAATTSSAEHAPERFRGAARDGASRSSMADVAVVDRQLRGRGTCCPTASRASTTQTHAPGRGDRRRRELDATAAPRSPRPRARACSRRRTDGLGFLYNRGVEAAAAEYVLLLNNDVALEPRCIELLAAELDADARALRRRPDAARLGGRARDPRAHDAAPRAAPARVHARACTSTRSSPADRVAPTVCANGAAMLVRRSLFARARRLRRDVLHGVGGPRPLLARLAARLADASTCRTRASGTASAR